MKKVYTPCYKIDTKGKTRVWFMEQNGSKYRTHAGIKDGKIVVSGWTQAEATNVGRANERNPTAQATFEIEAAYQNKLSREYHESLVTTKKGAHFFKPMLAEKYEKFAEGWAQPKLDGIRCIVNSDGMFSREGKPIVSCPHIFAALKKYVSEGKTFDGELYNHQLKEDFNQIVSLVRKVKPTAEDFKTSAEMVQFHVYDLPSDTGSFTQRITNLKNLYKDGLVQENSIVLVETVKVTKQEEFDNLHGTWLEAGYEGSIWRDGEAKYLNKRTKALLKRKDFIDDEFPCIRIEAGNGNWAGVAKKVFCKLPDGREFGAGIRGTRERAKALLTEKHKVVTVRYFNLTPDGIPRFGVVTKFHGNKREY